MLHLRELTRLANERFDHYLAQLPGPTPPHTVQFSRRITESWALIYYQRHLVRLSPYLFLLDPSELKRGSHWQELDATLRHEAAHAVHFARTGETGHSRGFHDLLARLGVAANGTCDLGPENSAFRYVYACRSCDQRIPRRLPLRGNWSCGRCAPGQYSHVHKLELTERLDNLGARLKRRQAWIEDAVREAKASVVVVS